MEKQDLELLLTKLLLGAQLDSIRAYNIALDLEFNQIGKPKLPITIYFTTSNPIWIIQDKDKTYEIDYKTDFFKQREKIISELYSLIGQEVRFVRVSNKGELTFAFYEKTFFLSRNTEEFETIWEIMDNTTDVKVNHDWHISWLEYNDVDLKIPENFQY
ncbi:hypothetical protein [Leptospira kirschneri]|uniref:hypothetical protein n=1 Tax=Leptospira kirschneri TaxID=29507 RepID=UPI000364589E|nr:hypothetical protein [Leptospira kirschneri]UML78823.1 hypothetical protein FH602_01625 [Leptospira kirschneri]